MRLAAAYALRGMGLRRPSMAVEGPREAVDLKPPLVAVEDARARQSGRFQEST